VGEPMCAWQFSCRHWWETLADYDQAGVLCL